MLLLPRARTVLAWIFFPIAGSACSAGADSASAPRATDPGGSDGSGVGDAGEEPPPLPPEKELESSYRSPVATGKYVWIANPRSGRVAYVDAASLDVQIAEAGNAPTYMAAVPSPIGDDVAVVLNVASHDATLLRRSPRGLETRTFRTHARANAWAVSRDGRWAIAWSDAAALGELHRTDGFQDLTVIDLTGAVPPRILAVGYRPVRLGFADDAARAWAVTQDGVSIIALGDDPRVVRNVPVSDDPLADPGSRDVSVTPDGAYALIRRDGEAQITIVGLESERRVQVSLAGPVTDLDVAEDGSRAIAVVRDRAEVSVLPLPAIVDSPTTFSTLSITGETVGSVSLARDGGHAALYTNAVPAERFTVLTLEPLAYRVMRLYAPVEAVLPTPDARNAVVIHALASPSPRPAFSLVPIAAGLPAKIVGTEAPIHAVALSPAGDRAFVTERDDAKKIHGLYVGKMPSLAVDRYPLASPPIAVGIVAGARRAYVAQEHPEGRITFVDLESGAARTLTGFELAARVVDTPHAPASGGDR
jgi:hypothetical protein